MWCLKFSIKVTSHHSVAIKAILDLTIMMIQLGVLLFAFAYLLSSCTASYRCAPEFSMCYYHSYY